MLNCLHYSVLSLHSEWNHILCILCLKMFKRRKKILSLLFPLVFKMLVGQGHIFSCWVPWLGGKKPELYGFCAWSLGRDVPSCGGCSLGDVEMGQHPCTVLPRGMGRCVLLYLTLLRVPRPVWSPWVWWLSHCCGWLSPVQGSMGTAPTSSQPPWCRNRSCSELLYLRFADAGIPWAPVPVGGSGSTFVGGRGGINSWNVCTWNYHGKWKISEAFLKEAFLRWSWLLRKAGTF